MAHGLSDDALKKRVYEGLQKKKKCELCEQHFFVDELPGAITYKSILELRLKWGAKPTAGGRMPSPSQLYKRCELCVFCMQFFNVDGLQDSPPGATLNSENPNASGNGSPNSPKLAVTYGSTQGTRK